MRIWPLSHSLNAEISRGYVNWVGSMFDNFRLLLAIRRSKSRDRCIDLAKAASAAKSGKRHIG